MHRRAYASPDIYAGTHMVTSHHMRRHTYPSGRSWKSSCGQTLMETRKPGANGKAKSRGLMGPKIPEKNPLVMCSRITTLDSKP